MLVGQVSTGGSFTQEVACPQHYYVTLLVWEHSNTRGWKSRAVVTISMSTKKTVFKRCQRCDSKNRVHVGENVRTIRLMPIGFRLTFAVLHLKIFRCKDCKTEYQEPIEDGKRRKYKHIAVIAINEILAKNRHDYLTIVTDLESGRVIFVAEGKNSECPTCKRHCK